MPGPLPIKTTSLLTWTVKAALAIGVLSLAATHFLAREGLDRSSLQRLAAESAARGREPVTTGTLAKNAGDTKLDPCATPARRS